MLTFFSVHLILALVERLMNIFFLYHINNIDIKPLYYMNDRFRNILSYFIVTAGEYSFFGLRQLNISILI